MVHLSGIGAIERINMRLTLRYFKHRWKKLYLEKSAYKSSKKNKNIVSNMALNKLKKIIFFKNKNNYENIF